MLAWEGFLNSDSDYLVCLEDDAFPLADCEKKLRTMFDRLQGRNEDLYVLLSRGVNQELLKSSANDSKNLDETLFETPLAYTNTTAGYLINKGMAGKFLAEVQNLPAGPLVNIDFLINFLFSRLNSGRSRPAIMCWHFSEPPIDNASISSDLGSTIS
jgi:GR25 family glycosyltransferase involved in LPS biosynthesis